MRNRDEVIRDIQASASDRRSKYQDMPDFLLRKYLLTTDEVSKETEPMLDITLKTILIIAYPDLFAEIDGRFQVNPALSELQAELIRRAFGISLATSQKTKDNFPIHPNQFDHTAFEELYRQQGNPLWLVLKQMIPVNTRITSSVTKSPIMFTPQDKIHTYLQLAEAFRAGSATQFAQKATQLFSRFRSTPAPSKVFKTPGPDKAIQGVYLMAEKACAIARAYPEFMPLIEANFVPSARLTEPLEASVRTQAQQLTATAKHVLTESHNLGDWLLIQSPLYAKDIDYVEKLQTLLSQSVEGDRKPAPDEIEERADDSPVIQTLKGIIRTYASYSDESTEGQRRTVARAMLHYERGELTWFSVLELMHNNPDWNTIEGLNLFKTPKLVAISNQIETTPIARNQKDFYSRLSVFSADSQFDKDIEHFSQQLRGENEPALNDIKIKQWERKGQSAFAALLRDISSYLTEHPVQPISQASATGYSSRK